MAATSADELAALRLVVLELTRNLADRSPDPDGYLESRHATILAAVAREHPGAALQRQAPMLRCLADFFAEARAAL